MPCGTNELICNKSALKLSVLKCFQEHELWIAAAQAIQRPGYGLDNREMEIRSSTGARELSLLHSFQTLSGATQLPTQWVPGTPSLEVKRPRLETDHSPPPNARIKRTWSYTSTPLYVFMPWCLIKLRDNLTLQLKEETKDNHRTDLSVTVRAVFCRPSLLYMGSYDVWTLLLRK
jgi:hypothetical protein